MDDDVIRKRLAQLVAERLDREWRTLYGPTTPEPPPLTLERLSALVDQFRPGHRLLRIVAVEHLSEPRALTRLERLRVRIEDGAEKAELIYPFPLVQRTRPMRTGLLVGDTLYCHPQAAEAIRRAGSGA